MNKEEMKRKTCEVIEENSDWIIAIGERILRHPKLGFREYETSDFVTTKSREMGLKAWGKSFLFFLMRDLKEETFSS